MRFSTQPEKREEKRAANRENMRASREKDDTRDVSSFSEPTNITPKAGELREAASGFKMCARKFAHTEDQQRSREYGLKGLRRVA